jgi:sortase (surface protein transpeptidase)
MAKKFLIILILIAASSGIWLGLTHQNQTKSENPTVLTAKIKPSATSSVQPSLTSQPVEVPVSLQIPKLNLQATIEQVGMDKQGRMDVPKNADNVGWYNLGYKPGDKGSAVMAGHLDKASGAPAVFWNVSKLHPGDTILVTEENGKRLTFSVSKVTNYPYNDFPLQEVFGASDEARLNLITCQGTWNKTTGNYSHRTVVFARLTQ